MQGLLSSSELWGRKNIDGEMEVLGCGRVGTCLHELSTALSTRQAAQHIPKGPIKLRSFLGFFPFLFCFCSDGLIFPYRDKQSCRFSMCKSLSLVLVITA